MDKFYPHSHDLGRAKKSSHKCAIVCCDEVIAEIEDLQQNCMMEFPMALEYWGKVKNHLQSL